MIHLTCPACSKPIDLPDSFSGKMQPCPHCGTPALVPEADPVDDAPLTVVEMPTVSQLLPLPEMPSLPGKPQAPLTTAVPEPPPTAPLPKPSTAPLQSTAVEPPPTAPLPKPSTAPSGPRTPQASPPAKTLHQPDENDPARTRLRRRSGDYGFEEFCRDYKVPLIIGGALAIAIAWAVGWMLSDYRARRDAGQADAKSPAARTRTDYLPDPDDASRTARPAAVPAAKKPGPLADLDDFEPLLGDFGAKLIDQAKAPGGMTVRKYECSPANADARIALKVNDDDKVVALVLFYTLPTPGGDKGAPATLALPTQLAGRCDGWDVKDNKELNATIGRGLAALDDLPPGDEAKTTNTFSRNGLQARMAYSREGPHWLAITRVAPPERLVAKQPYIAVCGGLFVFNGAELRDISWKLVTSGADPNRPITEDTVTIVWKAKLTNLLAVPTRFQITCSFYDVDNVLVVKTRPSSVGLRANEERQLAGKTTIPAAQANHLARLVIGVKRQR